jgi:hypothetical protein
MRASAAACDGRLSSFDIGVTAGLYSTVAGVMAGFAFVSLLYVITSDGLDDGDQRNVAAQALGAAFIALLLTSLTDAVLAGESVPAGRAATVEVLAGASLAIGGIHMIYALVPLIQLHPGRAESVTTFFRVVGGTFLCPLAYLLVFMASRDDYRATDAHPSALVDWVGWATLAVVAACAVASRHHLGFERLNRLKVNSSLLAIVAASAAIAAVGFVESAVGQCETAGPWLPAATFLCTAIALVNQLLAFEAPHANVRLRDEPARAESG